MTVKYTKGVISRNANVTSGVQMIPIFDDDGAKSEDLPAALKPYATVTEFSDGLMRRTKITLTNAPLSVADDAGQGQYGGFKIYDFPAGSLITFGAVVAGNLTMGVTGTFITTFGSIIALGSVTASTGATLVSTEADYMLQNSNSAAVASVAAVDAVTTAAQVVSSGATWLDGTATAKDMYLNFVIADDATHTAGSGTFTGTVQFVWMLLGDN